MSASVGSPAPPTFIPGIGHPLPPGERVLWTGAPEERSVVRYVTHARGLAWYFVALLLVPALFAQPDHSPLAALLTSALYVVPLGTCTVMFARLLARLIARTTVYAITDRRIVLKIGVALPTVINVPLHTVESCDLLVRRDGSGDIALTLAGRDRLAYLLLWPHARPWRVVVPSPMLRALAHPHEAADVLRDALIADRASSAAPVMKTLPMPVLSPAMSDDATDEGELLAASGASR